MDRESQFLFVTCQVGAEAAVKGEFARRWPDFRFAYSRPGFLTFKLPGQPALADDFDPQSVFARATGFTLGKVKGTNQEELARAAWQLAEGRSFARLHVWQRDLRAAGDHGYEPAASDAAASARAALLSTVPARAVVMSRADAIAKPGDLVLNCVLASSDEWWLGFHRARLGPSCRAGGLDDLVLPENAISRAYLKMAEALDWSRLPIAAGQQFVELGCAPGGSCQLLLERGLLVTGIDPAAMHADVLAQKNFTHLRKRASDVRRREFRKTRWLAADMNVAPDYTLDAVEAIVTHPEVHVEGLLLTLKLLDWELAAGVPDYLARIESWGYPRVAARQLQHGRQEICVAAVRPARRHGRGGWQVAQAKRRDSNDW
ncbi:MAG TPA: SAM-dependent methyltransferase [Pirellulales bacterium]|jgi:23S rRNA (cytidine2498-2'-O)-methyltransferase